MRTRLIRVRLYQIMLPQKKIIENKRGKLDTRHSMFETNRSETYTPYVNQNVYN